MQEVCVVCANVQLGMCSQLNETFQQHLLNGPTNPADIQVLNIRWGVSPVAVMR